MKKNMEVEGATKTCREILAEAEGMVQRYGWTRHKAYSFAHSELVAIWNAYYNINCFIAMKIVSYYEHIAFHQMMKH